MTHLRMWFAHHAQAAGNSLLALCRKPISTVMTVLVIAIALVLPALFWVITDNMARLTVNWQQGGHVSLYLKASLAREAETALLERVQTTVGVGHADLTTPAEGLLELQKQEGMKDIMRYLPENPLPAVIEVLPALDVNTPAKLEQLHLLLKSYPGVEQAKLDMQWVSRLHAILSLTAKCTEGLMVLLSVAVLLIIGNTVRLALHHRYEEIRVSKLVGAKDSYILRPFLYSGVWYGMAGAILAVGLVDLFLYRLTWVVAQLVSVYDIHYAFIGLSCEQMILLLFSAIFLGWFGAWLSVKRELSGIEP